jgi:xylan 1,4-beta-xylosidase
MHRITLAALAAAVLAAAASGAPAAAPRRASQLRARTAAAAAVAPGGAATLRRAGTAAAAERQLQAPTLTAAFTADVAGAPYALSFPLSQCFGSDHGLQTLRFDWRAQMAAVAQDTGVSHLRFHGILDDDMSTYLNGGANMFNVFMSYDYLLSLGVRPIVELSFMPELLASNPAETVFHYQGGISAPKNWTAWYNFIHGFVGACVERYGVQEVRTWRHEIWNEPVSKLVVRT